MQKEGAQCRRGKQQLQCGGWVTPGTGLEPVPVPHTDGRADGKAEEGSHGIDVVCRRHCTVRWQGSGHGGVLGNVEESPGRGGNPSQSTGDPVHGLFLRTERPRKETTSEDPWEEVERDKHFKHRRTSIEVEGHMETEIANRVEAAWKNWKRCSAWDVVREEDTSETEGECLQNSCQTSYVIWSGNMDHHKMTCRQQGLRLMRCGR